MDQAEVLLELPVAALLVVGSTGSMPNNSDIHRTPHTDPDHHSTVHTVRCNPWGWTLHSRLAEPVSVERASQVVVAHKLRIHHMHWSGRRRSHCRHSCAVAGSP